ncbi:galactoside alpha-(1,2)-fucosyltransferase 2-like [Gastrophryne carolinensis]
MALSMKHLFIWIFFIFTIVLLFINFSHWYYNNEGQKNIFSVLCAINQETVAETKLQQDVVKPLPGVWTMEPGGRLGNLMGQYAALYALAKINGRQPYIMPHMHTELSKLFRIRLPVIPQEVVNRIKWKRYMLRNWMLPEYRNISGEYVQLFSYTYSWTIYHHIREEILREFTFHDFIKQEANEYLTKIRGDRKNVTFIGVHVRRGDYVKYMARLKGVVAHKGYFDQSMAYYRNKYKNPLFVVTSNGMDWCKENINNSLGDVHFAGDNDESSPAHDFALLVHCNHTIMTIGSFGIWASYMTGGETIYLSNNIIPNSPYLKNFKYETSYLPEWIGIPADLSPLMGQKGVNKTENE